MNHHYPADEPNPPLERCHRRVFDCMDGLDNGIHALLFDRGGRLWAATRGGLCRFDGRRFQCLTDDIPGFPAAVPALFEARDGALWLATTKSGAYRLDKNRYQHFGPDQGLPDAPLWDICQDTQGRLWFATDDGPWCFDGDCSIYHPALQALRGIPCHALLFDRQERLWIGTAQGVACLNAGTLTWPLPNEVEPNRVWDLMEDRHGRVWAALEQRGLFLLDGGKAQSASDLGIPFSETVYQVYEDHAGRIWLATFDSGLLCWDGTRLDRYTTDAGLHENRVSCMTLDSEQQLWIGHNLAGVTRFELQGMMTVCREPVTESMASDHEGRIWYANGQALCHVDSDSNPRVVKRYPGRVMAVLVDRQGRIWAGGLGWGLERYDTPADALAGRGFTYGTGQGMVSGRVTELHEGPSGTLWVGTGRPGSVGRVVGDTVESIPVAPMYVFRILEDSRGRVWFGGYEGGGLCMHADGKTVTFTEADGLPDDRVQSLVEDDSGGIWVGTQNGLFLFDGESFSHHVSNSEPGSHFHQVSARDASGVFWFGTLRGGLFRTDGRHLQLLTVEDGLPSNSVTALLPDPDGSMLLGTYGGTVRYRPAAFQPPDPEITEVIAQDRFPSPESLELTADQARVVTVRFRAWSLSTRRMRYVIRLEGRDADWRETWDTEVRYEDIPEGEHTFCVHAVNRDLVMSEQPATVYIRVVPDPLREQLAVYETKMDQMEKLLAYHERTRQHDQALMALATSSFRPETAVGEVLSNITEAACAHLDADQCAVWLTEENGRLLRLADMFTRADGSHVSGELVTLERSGYAGILPVLENRRALAIDDTAIHPATDDPEWQARLGARGLLVSAVRVGGRVAGILSLSIDARQARWSTEDEQFAGSLADLVAMALETGERFRAQEALRQSEDQLRQSLKMEAVGRLAGGVAHDFNNLLTAIMGCADLVLELTPPGDPKRGPLQEIRRAGERAAALIRQLMAFSRKAPVKNEVIDVARLVTDTGQLLRRLISESIHLEIVASPGSGCIEADSGQIEMILVNLAVNARDAMPDGGTLSIRTGGRVLRDDESLRWPSCPPGRYVCIEVIDTGCGMSEDVRQRAFEPFFTTKRHGDGTGLGLSTVYGIVQQFGGGIELKAAPGKGTAFTILFPYSPKAARTCGTPDTALETARAGTETILVVEDEEVVRSLVSRLLSGLGYDVLTASNPRDAIRLSRELEKPIHLLLSDVVMPAMNGPEMACILAQERPGMRILFMSGYADNVSVRELAENDSVRLVQKPFTRDELATAVREVLESSS